MKYFRTFTLALQVNLQSRANLFLWLVVGAIGPLTMLMAWFAIMGERTSIQNFTRGDFLTYYLFTTFGWYIVGGTFSRSIGRAIKSGNISQSLLKPYSFVFKSVLEEQAWKLTSLLISLPILIAIVWFNQELFQFRPSLFQLSLIAVSLLLGATLFALIEAIIGCTAFWFTEVWPLAEIFDVFLNVLGGTLAPLLLMPQLIQNIAVILPFKYIFYVPVTLMLNKNNQPLIDIGIQLLYSLIAFALLKIILKSGIKRYEAIGN